MEPVERKIFVGLYLFVVILQVHSDQDLSLCSKCSSPLKNDSKVVSYCESDKSFEMFYRCCTNTNHSVVYGLDLTGCKIKELHGKMFEEYLDMDILSLPNINSSCPGGADMWDNITVHADYVECIDQVNTCIFYNLSCPLNSNCTKGGPGYAECHCDPGYYGYKCKRTGHFPMDVYGISTAAGVILVSAVFWFTERRKIGTL
ncbi:all-trans retinoic acid-induced differentiation factor [Octopus vulgaris]|uniref:All-trans retinoic acid-induced differentiation factor n=1 Tax=Octopus vulgaris TaxID=6645 RepID=A0AA36F4V0_OCTVU|nr:all-trans retinoic acid-induced differentiation factor [Octopus vulgaris]